MDKDLKKKLEKLGIKSTRIGGTGTMRMKAKKKRLQKEKPNEEPIVKEDEEMPELIENLDQDIENLEQELYQLKN